MQADTGIVVLMQVALWAFCLVFARLLESIPARFAA